MAQRVKSVKQKLANGTYSGHIPLGVDGIYVDLANGNNLETTLGNVNVSEKGNIQTQLDTQDAAITSNRLSIESNDVDIADLQNKVALNKTNIEGNNTNIIELQNRASADEIIINNNTNAINTLDKKIDLEVDTLNKNIASIEGAFNGDLSALVERVGNAEKDIITNETNITKNTQAIVDNKTATDTELAKKLNSSELVKIFDSEKEYTENQVYTVDAIHALAETLTTDITNTQNTLQNDINTRATKTELETGIADKITKAEAAPFVKGIEYNGSTYTFTFTKYDNSTQTVELPLENLIERGYYDTETEEIVLVLSSGEDVRIPAASLVDDYTGKENTQIKVNVANNEIEAVLKTGSVTEEHLDAALQTRLDTIEDNMATRSEFVEVESW